MRRLPAVVAALLLPAAQPLLLGAAFSAGVVLITQAPARAQSAEAVAEVAKTITVRIEGATQGSGVLVKRDGNRYTVLTAWHVVSSQGPREELDVYTPDGKRHSVEQGSIQRLGVVDMAVLSFSSSTAYEVASVGDVKSVSSGSSIYVSGFPLPTSAVPLRIFRFKEGRLEANAQVFIPNGYQLLYSNPTLPGMSGGAVLNAQGQLVGIHGQSETDSLMSEQKEVAVKTGTNQAIPIVYYKQYLSGIRAPITVNREKTLENDALAEKYYLDGNMKFVLGDKRGAIVEYNKAITAKPQYADAYKNRGRIRLELGDEMGAISDFDKAIEINPQFGDAFFHRSRARSLSDPYEACQDMLKSAALGSSGAKKNISSACREHPSI